MGRGEGKTVAMTSFWPDKRVVVTGGAGFLGSFVVEQLRTKGCRQIIVPRSRDYDLVEMEAVRRLYADTTPDIFADLTPKDVRELMRLLAKTKASAQKSAKARAG